MGAESVLVDVNRKLLKVMQKNIQTAVERVWAASARGVRFIGMSENQITPRKEGDSKPEQPKNIIGHQVMSMNQFSTRYRSYLAHLFPVNDGHKEERLEELLGQLRTDLWVLIEFPYTDKLYRDTYYHFYSARHQTFPRECIRVMLFEKEVKIDQFLGNSEIEKVQELFLGYFVLRPIKSRVLGRSMINPQAFSNKNFLTCLSRGYISMLGNSFQVDAYPHSTQDGLAISCAETSLWSVMEYFGNRYPEYNSILPSAIYDLLRSTYSQRSVPSNGLTAAQISTALRRLKFGTRIYAIDKARKRENEILNIISTYVESGIPVIIIVEGEEFGAHALALIGHESLDEAKLRALVMASQGPCDSADIEKDFVCSDDNRPVYQKLKLKAPLSHYTDTKFHNGKIGQIIVPLYERIYLDAIKARKLANRILDHKTLGYKSDNQVSRLFLTSSRSLKRWLQKNLDLPPKLRNYLLRIHLPRFVWLAEYATKENYLQARADSLVCLDATGDDATESLLFARYPNFTLWLNSTTGKHDRINIPSPAIRVYQNNLKGEWNGWKST